MPRPCHILILGDMPSEMAILREAFYDAHWYASVDEICSEDGDRFASIADGSDMTHHDILIVDIHPRGESCVEVLARIREMPGCSHQPIIVCTTSRLSHSAMYECIGLGVLEVVIKPRTYAGIAAMVASIRSHLTSTGDLSPAGAWIRSGHASAHRHGC